MVSSGRWAKLQNDDQNLLYPLYLTAIFYLILKGFKSWGNMMDCFPKYGPVRIIPKKRGPGLYSTNIQSDSKGVGDMDHLSISWNTMNCCQSGMLAPRKRVVLGT